MNRKVLFILVGGIAAVGATVWETYPSRTSFIGDPAQYKFMHCSRCRKELKFDVDQYVKGCPQCYTEMVPTEASIAVTGKPPSPVFRMAAWILLEACVVMADVLWVTRRGPPDPDADYLYITCEKCTQKIRYLERQIGQMAMCRRCKRPFTYPEAADE